MCQFPTGLSAARTGAEWAWTEIYRDLAASVLGYLRARGAADPEDLAGEVFLQVVRDLGRFEGGEREFRAWVFMVAHHRLIENARGRARRPADPTEQLPTEELRSRDAQEKAFDSIGTDRVRRPGRRG